MPALQHPVRNRTFLIQHCRHALICANLHPCGEWPVGAEGDAAGAAADGAAGGADEAAPEVDPLALLDPVEVLSQVPDNLEEQLVRPRPQPIRPIEPC